MPYGRTTRRPAAEELIGWRGCINQDRSAECVDMSSTDARARAAGYWARPAGGAVRRRDAGGTVPFEQAVDEKRQTEDCDESADAHPDVWFAARDANHEEQPDANTQKDDAGAPMAGGTCRPLDAVVAVHGAIEA